MYNKLYLHYPWNITPASVYTQNYHYLISKIQFKLYTHAMAIGMSIITNDLENCDLNINLYWQINLTI